LLLDVDTAQIAQENPTTLGFMFAIFLVFAMIAGAAFYVYKKEYKAKYDEFDAVHDNEEGYQKLD
jgi:Mn2+/Fe2+ NRAMP family transporter